MTELIVVLILKETSEIVDESQWVNYWHLSFLNFHWLQWRFFDVNAHWETFCRLLQISHRNGSIPNPTRAIPSKITKSVAARIMYLVRQLYGNYHWKDESALKPGQCDAYWRGIGQQPPIERRRPGPPQSLYVPAKFSATVFRQTRRQSLKKKKADSGKRRSALRVEPGPTSYSKDETKSCYFVETILDKSWERGKELYLVKWAGFDDPADNTWEPKDHFRPEVLAVFEKRFSVRNEELV